MINNFLINDRYRANNKTVVGDYPNVYVNVKKFKIPKNFLLFKFSSSYLFIYCYLFFTTIV